MLDSDDLLTSFTSIAAAHGWYTAITAPSTKLRYSVLMIFSWEKEEKIHKYGNKVRLLVFSNKK